MSPRILKRVAREPGQLLESDLWRTPPQLFMALHQEFNFELDCAADEESTLCEAWMGPGSPTPDALLVPSWKSALPGWEGFPRPGVRWGFLNPPYSSLLIAQFVEWTVEQSKDMGIVALLPDTHDTRWYRHLRWAAEIRRIPHRVPYLKSDGTTKAGAMFPSCVAIFRPQPGVRNPQPRIVEWTWRTE